MSFFTSYQRLSALNGADDSFLHSGVICAAKNFVFVLKGGGGLDNQVLSDLAKK